MNILNQLIISETEFLNLRNKDFVKAKCSHCNNIFSRKKKQIQRNIYGNTKLFCSTKCSHSSTKKQDLILVTCRSCEKSFLKTQRQINKNPIHCCSKSCVNRYRWRNHIKKERTCSNEGCKTITHYRNKNGFCKDCYSKLRRESLGNLTLKDFRENLSVKGKHPSWLNCNIRNMCRSHNSELANHPCQVCGYNKHIEFCHIKAVASFDLNTKINAINSPDNLLILCPNCHWEFDQELIKLENIPKRNMVGYSGFEPDFSTPSTAKNLEDSPG